ncbi:MAG: GNAT family N-acetyltransferase [Pseudomonadota bacterium]
MSGRVAAKTSTQARGLSEGLELRCQPPQTLEPGLLDEIEALVLSGQAVGPGYVRHNLERAHLIAYALAQGRVVATVSLKHPRPEYVARLKQRTGLDLDGFLERGYTSVRPDFRGQGLGTLLVDYLTRQAAGRQIYVVIASDNLGAQAITRRNRTRLVAQFRSQATGQEYGIWIQEPPVQS